MKTFHGAAVATAVALTAAGQPLRVVSEFQRVTAAGQVYAPDRVEKSREVISPAVARNAWASFRVIVEAPKGSAYSLYVGQNPDNAAKTKCYQEKYTKAGEAWVPDALEAVELPVSASMPENQIIQSYWLDVWVPRETPAGRFRYEAQLYLGGTWYIAPMEVRVRDVVLPGATQAAGTLPDVAERADSAVLQPLRQYVCGTAAPAATGELSLTARKLIRRNAQQDIALGRLHERDETRAAVQYTLVKAAGYSSVDAFCQSTGLPQRGAEWWLKARDYVLQGLPVR